MATRERRATVLMTLLGGMWLGLFPLWQDGSYTRITRAKWTGMLLFTGVTAAVVLGLLLFRLIRKRGEKPRLHPTQGLALAYLGWLALSALFGSMADSVNSQGQLTVWMGAIRYEGLATQCCYILLFLLMSLYPSRLKAVMAAASVGLLVYSGIVAMQYAGLNPFHLFPPTRDIRIVPEFQGPIGNIDVVSGWLCLIVPALMFAYVLSKERWLCLPGMTVGTLLLLLIRVQSGLLTLAAVLALLVLAMLMFPQIRPRGCYALSCALTMITLWLLLGLPWHNGTEDIVFPHAMAAWKLLPLLLAVALIPLGKRFASHPGPAVPGRWMILLVCLGLAAAVVLLLFFPFPEGGGLWEIQEALHGRGVDSFGSERYGIWRLTLEMSRQHLLFGTGPDTFWYAMQDYMYETGQTTLQNFDNPHNLLLAVLANNGVPALLLYLALMIAVAVTCLRAGRRDGWPLALLAGLAAHLLQGMFTFSICLVTPMFWVMLGMAVSQACQREDANHDYQL